MTTARYSSSIYKLIAAASCKYLEVVSVMYDCKQLFTISCCKLHQLHVHVIAASATNTCKLLTAAMWCIINVLDNWT